MDVAALKAIHARLPGARYIICGPQEYMKAAHEMLLELGVRPERVQLEIFTHVGHAPTDTTLERSIAKQLQLIVTLGFCVFYLVQNALGWGLPGLAALQQLDAYSITTGSALIAFIGYQWYLPYLRLTGNPAHVESQWHTYLGVLAPVLLYLHSVSMGVAYTVVLSSLFVLNTMLGAVGKTSIKNLEWRQRFRRIVLLVHVPASCLLTALALIHMVYALAYK
jgi:hypothetical protein